MEFIAIRCSGGKNLYIKVSIQDLDKIMKNSFISDHKHNGLDETLEEILKPPCSENREYGEGKTYEFIFATSTFKH